MIYKQLFFLIFLASGCSFAVEEEQSSAVEPQSDVQEYEDVSEKIECADDLLELVKDEDIPVPDIKPPSKLMEWVRVFGIGCVMKYYAFKGWLSKKWYGETDA